MYQNTLVSFYSLKGGGFWTLTFRTRDGKASRFGTMYFIDNLRLISIAFEKRHFEIIRNYIHRREQKTFKIMLFKVEA